MSKILITGGSRGIGAGVALNCSGLDQAELILTYQNRRDQADQVAELCRQKGASVHLVQADLSDPIQIKDLLARSFDLLGRIDCLVNNAGITRDALSLRMTEEQWDQVLDVNLKAAFLLAKGVLKGMIRKRYGRIINISSVIAHRSRGGQLNYAASKGGLEALTRALAVEVASRNITVNAVVPGWIQTDMTQDLELQKRDQGLESTIPVGRIGQVEDIAHAVSFLMSPQSSYITGQALVVDGGLSIRL